MNSKTAFNGPLCLIPGHLHLEQVKKYEVKGEVFVEDVVSGLYKIRVHSRVALKDMT